jgi:hypothetical protein
VAVYNLQNTIEQGRLVRVFDANGVEVQHCIKVDTVTGQVLRYKMDVAGRFIVKGDAAQGTGELEVEMVTLPAPLRVTPLPDTIVQESVGIVPALLPGVVTTQHPMADEAHILGSIEHGQVDDSAATTKGPGEEGEAK